jgi:hypothetical protein
MITQRRSLFLAGGSLVLLAAVGVGLVQASTAVPSVASTTQITPAAPAAAAQDRAGKAADGIAAAMRLRGRANVVHGVVTIDSPKEGLITVQFDGGTISAVDADSVTIAEKGGASVTVAIDSDTKVRRERKKAAAGDLKVGDLVRVVSRVASGGSVTAKAIIVPPAAS